MTHQPPRDDAKRPYTTTSHTTTPHSASNTHDSPSDRRDDSPSDRHDAASADGRSPADGSPTGTRSTGVSRRQVVRSLGAGAALLGGSSALSGAAAGQSDEWEEDVEPRVEGIEDWSLTTEEISESEVQDGPTVAFEDGEIVVTGSHVFPQTGCDTFVVRRLVSNGGSRLGVVVDSALTYDPAVSYVACADALMPLRYELRVATEEYTREVVVEESFTEGAQRSLHTRVDRSLDVPPEVEDYDFGVGAEYGPDNNAVLSPSDADAMEPTVTFDGDTVIVEGAMTYGSGSCNEIALTRIERAYDVEGHVAVGVEASTQSDWMPGDPCTTDVAADYYRLELTGSGEPPIERCSVTEAGPSATHRLLVEEADADLELPDGVLDHRLEMNETDVSFDDLEADPSVSFDASEGDDAPDTVVIEGTTSAGSSTCNTLAVGELAWQDDSQEELLARVDTASRDSDFSGCTDDDRTVDYRLELTVEELPGAVTAQEGHEASEEPDRSVTVERDDGGEPELPEGVLDTQLEIVSSGDWDERDADPTVDFQSSEDPDAPDAVVVEGTMSGGSSTCHTLGVSALRWRDDDRTHLLAGVDTVERDDSPDVCTDDDRTVAYRLELTVEELPGTVTAQEQIQEDGEAERSVTVERDGDDLPAGVVDYEFTVGDQADDDAVAADPSVSTGESADGPVVTVEGAILENPCYSPALIDLGWEADGHLSVTVGVVGDDDYDGQFFECPPDVEPYGAAYTVEVVLESLPDAVTASERISHSSDPPRTVTVELDDAPCAGAAGGSETVDGRTVCDVDGDGYYRDVTGDGSVGQTDVVEFFEVQHRDAWKQPELFDFSGNGEVGHGDVVELFEFVATQP